MSYDAKWTHWRDASNKRDKVIKVKCSQAELDEFDQAVEEFNEKHKTDGFYHRERPRSELMRDLMKAFIDGKVKIK